MNNEFNRHIVLRGTQATNGGFTRTFDLDIFDPQLMYDHTPLSDTFVDYYSAALYKGVRLDYSHADITDYKGIAMVTLCGGSREVHKEIVDKFDQFFRSLLEEKKLLEVSQPVVDDEDNYLWTIVTNTNHR